MSHISITNLNAEKSGQLMQDLLEQECSVWGGTLYLFKDGYINVPDGNVHAVPLFGYDRKKFREVLIEVGYPIPIQPGDE